MTHSSDSQSTPLVPPHARHICAEIFSGSGTGQSIELRRVVSLVGSRPGCKIALRHAKVNPVHFAIINTGDEVYLRDLLSQTGTFLNGLKAECEKLEDGDVIQVAAWEIRISLVPPQDKEATGSSVVNLEPTPTVIALKGEGEANPRLTKFSRQVNLIGRKNGADYQIPSKQVSRRQALVFMLHGRPVIADLLSENGFTVNDEPTLFTELHSGDVLGFGDSRIRVIVPSPTIEPARADSPDVKTDDTVVHDAGNESDMIDISAEMGSR